MSRTRSPRPVPTLLWTFLLLAGALLPAARAGAQESRVIVLHNADSLVGSIVNGESVKEWIGNVRFSQGRTFVNCDRAVQFEASGDVQLIGRVVVTEDSVTMKAPRGMYHREARMAEAFDEVSLDDGTVRLTARYGEYFTDLRQAFFRSQVVVRDSASVVTADSLRYFRDGKHSVAMGKVKVVNPPDNVTIWGGRLDHESVHEFSRMTVNPVLMQLDTSASGTIDTLLVRSRVMESYRDTVKRLVAIDSVEILRADLAGTAGMVQFFSAGDSILFRRSPVVWYQQTQVTGDSLNVYLRQRKLYRVSVMGNAFAVSRGDSLHPDRYDQLTGDGMQLFFRNQALDRIDVDNHAISVYHLYEDSLGNGLNRTSGDRIIMTFDAGKLRTIRVQGGVEGQYYPENMIRKREREYALPGFQWRESRPQILPPDTVGVTPVATRR